MQQLNHIQNINNTPLIDISTGVVHSPATPVFNATNLIAIIENFLNDKSVSKVTHNRYKRTIKLFFTWVNKNGYQLHEARKAHVIAYQNYLLNKELTALTVGSYLSIVKDFYQWGSDNNLCKNVAKGVNPPKARTGFVKQPLTPNQVTELLAHMTTQTKRDYAIINLLVRTGMRTIEVERANVEDIKIRGTQRILEVQGKGLHDKTTFVVLADKAFKPIEEYLNSRGVKSGSEPLFTSTSNRTRGGRLRTRSISRIAKEALQAIGLDDKVYTAHSLRHTVGTNIVLATGSYEEARKTLRHANIETTMLYTSTIEDIQRLNNGGEHIINELY